MFVESITMRFPIFIAFLVLGVSFPVVGQEQDKPASPILPANEDGSPGSGLRPWMNTDEDAITDLAVRETDVVYGRKHGMALTMDVYTPKAEANGAAIIYILNGGYWSGPEYRAMEYCTDHIRSFLGGGFTVFVVLQGSIPRYSIEDMTRDIHRSIQFVRSKSKTYAIEPDKIGLFGHSSGGHLALLVATKPLVEKPNAADPVEHFASKVNAVVAIAPPTDLLNIGGIGKLVTERHRDLGFANQAAFDFKKFDEMQGILHSLSEKQVADKLREVSPFYHVSASVPPALLVHGENDNVVPIEQSTKFMEQMREKNAMAELLLVPNKGHEALPSAADDIVEFFKRNLSQ